MLSTRWCRWCPNQSRTPVTPRATSWGMLRCADFTASLQLHAVVITVHSLLTPRHGACVTLACSAAASHAAGDMLSQAKGVSAAHSRHACKCLQLVWLPIVCRLPNLVLVLCRHAPQLQSVWQILLAQCLYGWSMRACLCSSWAQAMSTICCTTPSEPVSRTCSSAPPRVLTPWRGCL